MASYLGYQRHQWRPATARLRIIQLRQLTEWLHPTTLVDATEDDLLAWHVALTGAAQTIASYTSAARGLYQWMVTPSRLRADDPTVVLRRPHVDPGTPRPMADPHVELALASAAAVDPEMHLWLVLMACSGLRCCEIAWLQVRDVEICAGSGALAHLTGKGGKRRTVPIGQMLLPALAPHLRRPGVVFRRPSDGGAYTPSAVSAKINAFLRGLGIAETAHQLRHRMASDYHALDPDMSRLARIMGHSSTRTTEGYVAVAAEAASEHVDELTRRRVVRRAPRGRDRPEAYG